MNGRGGVRVTAASSLALAAAVVPVFLLGALSGQLGEELGVGPAALGVVLTVFFAAAGIAAVPFGRVTERIGAGAAMRLGVAVSAAVCVAIALVATSFWQLVALMAVGGSVVGLIDTGTARAFAERVHAAHRGLAFGVKEASVPVASMLAGVSVPLLALTFGWRAAFAAGAVLAPIVWVALPPLLAGDGRRSYGRAKRAGPSLVALAIGVGFGAGAANSGATFLVPAAAANGLTVGAAGTLLAVASVASVIARVSVGWVVDRTTRPPAGMVAIAMAVGALGGVVLAVNGPLGVVIGAVLLLGGGWGWTGLAFLAAVRSSPQAPAAAAGVVLTGLAVGGAVGPVLFGSTAARWSYGHAWALVAVALALGAGIIASAGARLTGSGSASQRVPTSRLRRAPG